MQLLEANCRFAAPAAVALIKADREKKKQQVEAEIKSFGEKIDVSGIPLEELKNGDGPVLQAELKWQRFLALPHVAENEAKCKACASLDALLQQWRNEEARRLEIAGANILNNATLRRICYAACVGRMNAEILTEIGMRTGNIEALGEKLEAWQRDEWTPLKTGAAEDGGSAKVDARLGLPAGWNYRACLPVPGAPNVSKTVQESVALWAGGMTPEVVGMKREKQIAAATVVGHLLVAFQNGDARVLDNMERFLEFFPTRGEVDRIEDAAAGVGVDVVEAPKELKPVVEKLGGDNDWYSLIRFYVALKKAQYPFGATEEPSAKRQKTG